MKRTAISGGLLHKLPLDLETALSTDAMARETWEKIIPLARNEWICWIESAKKLTTQNRRIEWEQVSNISNREIR